jgi:putative ABC transport system permease protein
MSILKLLLAEIRYRKINFAMSLLAVAAAVTLFVAGPVLVDGYGRETKTQLDRLQERVAESQARVTASEKEAAQELAKLGDDTRVAMLGLGFNLSIVHRDTDMIDFLSTGMPTVDMPQEYVKRLADDPSLTMITHLVAILRAKTTWEGHEVTLDGYLPETTQSHMRHPKPLGYVVEPGTVFLGFQLAKGRKVGDTIEVMGKPFRVVRLLAEQGSREDSTITMHLTDAQALLGKDNPPAINEILALECRCAEADLPKIRGQLADSLKDTLVVRDVSRAVARSRQRAMVQQKYDSILARHKLDLEAREQDLAATTERREKIQHDMETLAGVITTLVVLAAAAWVGLLALANVRERTAEIGVLRALGKSSARIAALFLGKAVLLGLLGAALGFFAGTGIGFFLGTEATRSLGFDPLYAAADHFSFPLQMLVFALVGAPVLSALASYLPTLSAITQDPAVVLRDH